MACERYLNAIHDAVDGSIGPIRRAELELHMEQCAECRALFEELGRIRDAAAALVIAVGSAVTLMYRGRGGTPASPSAAATTAAGNAAAPSPVEAVQAVDVAQQQFEKAIADLEKVAKANQQALDSSTSATIDKNLGILDQAIAENRAAVKAEPASVAARATLFDALRQKVSLLQDTISLINEMRKGNNAAAAQLVNKS